MSSWENLDQAFESLETELVDIVRGLSVEVWNGVLRRTPQFYGRAAASWTYSVGDAPVFVDRSEYIDRRELDSDETRRNKFDEFTGLRQGNVAAISISNAENLYKDRAFNKLGQTVWIANGVDHGQGAYAGGLEDGTIVLRAVNQPGRPITRTLDAVTAKYGDDVAPSRIVYLKSLRLGEYAT